LFLNEYTIHRRNLNDGHFHAALSESDCDTSLVLKWEFVLDTCSWVRVRLERALERTKRQLSACAAATYLYIPACACNNAHTTFAFFTNNFTIRYFVLTSYFVLFPIEAFTYSIRTYSLPSTNMTMTMPCNSATTNAIIVPTKVEDNCSYASLMPKNVVDQEGSKFDAFEYYSSDLLRLKTLLLSTDDDDEDDDDELNDLAAVNDILRSAGLSNITANYARKDDSKRRRGNNSQPIKKQKESGTSRKTRLSWELHPSLILHELYQVEEDIPSISDDEVDGHETKSSERRWLCTSAPRCATSFILDMPFRCSTEYVYTSMCGEEL